MGTRVIEDGVMKVVGDGIRKQNRCQGITKSKGNQNKRNKGSKSKNKGKVKLVYDTYACQGVEKSKKKNANPETWCPGVKRE